MIRTVIEIEGKDEYEFQNNFRTTMSSMGYTEKKDEEYGRFFSDLRHALLDMKLDPNKLVEDYRMKLATESFEARGPIST